jgi:cytochrome c
MRLGTRATLIGALLFLSACEERQPVMPMMVEGGDPERGKVAARAFGCGSCHRIPTVPGAEGNVGPPLDGLAQQGYIAGVLANTPENMVRWIMNPQEINPGTAMPDLGVTEGQARDIAAFLYSIEER